MLGLTDNTKVSSTPLRVRNALSPLQVTDSIQVCRIIKFCLLICLLGTKLEAADLLLGRSGIQFAPDSNDCGINDDNSLSMCSSLEVIGYAVRSKESDNTFDGLIDTRRNTGEEPQRRRRRRCLAANVTAIPPAAPTTFVASGAVPAPADCKDAKGD